MQAFDAGEGMWKAHHSIYSLSLKNIFLRVSCTSCRLPAPKVKKMKSRMCEVFQSGGSNDHRLVFLCFQEPSARHSIFMCVTNQKNGPGEERCQDMNVLHDSSFIEITEFPLGLCTNVMYGSVIYFRSTNFVFSVSFARETRLAPVRTLASNRFHRLGNGRTFLAVHVPNELSHFQPY